MARRLIWAPASLRDVGEIARFIQKDSPRHARIVVQKIRAACREVCGMPFAAPIVPEFDRPDIRQKRVYDYRIILRVREKEVEVLAVIHGARDLPPLLALPD